VDIDTLRYVGKKAGEVPDGFKIHRQMGKIFQSRQKMAQEGTEIDWGLAEAMAFGTLLLEGNHVRLTGQDVSVFAFDARVHLYSSMRDSRNMARKGPARYIQSSSRRSERPGHRGGVHPAEFPRENAPHVGAVGGIEASRHPGKADCAKFDPLRIRCLGEWMSSDTVSLYLVAYLLTRAHFQPSSVKGFEHGYSLENPNALVLWEAQFGDFVNGAQVMLDQFIAAGEDKWLRQSGLVLLLPHGYDGQGAEHSSCRVERYLQMMEEDPHHVPSMGKD
jgi:2-oxoglutarate dehydrogenase E1 component